MDLLQCQLKKVKQVHSNLIKEGWVSNISLLLWTSPHENSRVSIKVDKSFLIGYLV